MEFEPTPLPHNLPSQKKKKYIYIYIYEGYCSDWVWALFLRNKWIQAQQVQYNKFVESGKKNWALMSVITVKDDLKNE